MYHTCMCSYVHICMCVGKLVCRCMWQAVTQGWCWESFITLLPYSQIWLILLASIFWTPPANAEITGRPIWHLLENWGSELWFQCLPGRCVLHWVISLTQAMNSYRENWSPYNWLSRTLSAQILVTLGTRLFLVISLILPIDRHYEESQAGHYDKYRPGIVSSFGEDKGGICQMTFGSHSYLYWKL